VKLWDAESGQPLGALEHPGEVLGVAVWAPGGLLAVAGADGTVKVWRIDSLRGGT
jgi:WD40 repeat protein